MSRIPSVRLQVLNEAPINPKGEFVLYWMLANRRTTWNFSLERAVEWSRELDKPLLLLETLHCWHGWANDRMASFAVEGMVDTAKRLEGSAACYYPYVEPVLGEAQKLLKALADRTCVVVTDEFPTSVVPSLAADAARSLSIRLEQVDSNGLLPLRATNQVFPTAHSFRRFLQRTLPAELDQFPKANPLAKIRLRPLRKIPNEVRRKWPTASDRLLRGDGNMLASLPIGHSVSPVSTRGGAKAAQAALRRFLKERLTRYPEERNQPEEEVVSGLSPYLHFGHISAHDIFTQLMAHENWKKSRLASRATGGRSGWWRASPAAEAFLDQLITWREVGYNMCSKRTDYDKYESLPEWARKTLAEHRSDPRIPLYDLEDFEAGRTHDDLWNAAQMQLVREGRLHNYLRMLWGKKILHWSASPQEALAIMIELNNKYALDGQNPNSYSGIFWILGRYDRPWGPVRPIFGSVRYMSSENTARKVRVKDYIRKYAP
ncbi:MAG: deoxyribodipyrimidine photolyase [Armatimonadetes bacterium]|nr:deoxyribodipyrimidine photolyase [Armatimonadota bacterium]NIO75946.1 deoxyribodipyrimidine photolyase [Armatimonadota bacterium]NIO98758.1 deoxyribodipyrimidine photolyase [Armatimonadota bacterium]